MNSVYEGSHVEETTLDSRIQEKTGMEGLEHSGQREGVVGGQARPSRILQAMVRIQILLYGNEKLQKVTSKGLM